MASADLDFDAASPFTLANVVGSLGVFSVLLGIGALIKPLVFLVNFDIPASRTKSIESKKVASDLLRVYGTRNLALGLAIVSASYYENWEVMGWSMVGVAVIATVDGFISRSNERGGEWKHWGFIGVSLGLAAACFGYF